MTPQELHDLLFGEGDIIRTKLISENTTVVIWIVRQEEVLGLTAFKETPNPNLFKVKCDKSHQLFRNGSVITVDQILERLSL